MDDNSIFKNAIGKYTSNIDSSNSAAESDTSGQHKEAKRYSLDENNDNSGSVNASWSVEQTAGKNDSTTQ